MWLLQAFLCLNVCFWLASAQSAAEDNKCTTPSSAEGNCVAFSQCPSLKGKDKISLRRESFCRKSGYTFCCPLDELNNSNDNDESNNVLTDNILLPRPPYCGVQEDKRVLGGVQVGLTDFPWMALLMYRRNFDQMLIHRCGGTLINRRYVLTAAHCLTKPGDESELVSVRLGEWDIRQNPDFIYTKSGSKITADNYREVAIEEAISHKYSAADYQHDIALLRLSENVTFTNYIQPVCLPKPGIAADNYAPGTLARVVGWGATEHNMLSSIKMGAMIDIRTMEDCRKGFESVVEFVHIPAMFNTQICAGGEKGVDTCKGDSGGPLMVQERVDGVFAFYSIGVVSYGYKHCGTHKVPGVYTRVASYMNWINSKVTA